MSDKIEVIKNRVFSRNPPSILYKSEYYALYEAGFFGNKARTWGSYDEIIKSGYNGTVSMRSKKGINRKMVRYRCPINEIQEEIMRWQKNGHPKEAIGFNESMPDEYLTIQGELMRTDTGLFFLYSTLKETMNTSLEKESFRCWGLEALSLVRAHISPASLSDMESILETFPNDIIEFSSYSVPVGDIPGRNTVIWEVRGY